jgi:hypothetical protein
LEIGRFTTTGVAPADTDPLRLPTAIILLTWLFTLPHHRILRLAVPLIAIYIPVAITNYRHSSGACAGFERRYLRIDLVTLAD